MPTDDTSSTTPAGTEVSNSRRIRWPRAERVGPRVIGPFKIKTETLPSTWASMTSGIGLLWQPAPRISQGALQSIARAGADGAPLLDASSEKGKPERKPKPFAGVLSSNRAWNTEHWEARG